MRNAEAAKLTSFAIHKIAVAGGILAIAPMPGRGGAYASDFSRIADWAPSLVISVVEAPEFLADDMRLLESDLAALKIAWRHIPVPDFGVPTSLDWPEICSAVLSRLRAGQHVLIHCMGGCGRSGMFALRLIIAAGEPADAALVRLRQTRPCAVETDAQMAWAMQDAVRG